jgi:hypothetical protein
LAKSSPAGEKKTPKKENSSTSKSS